MSMLLSAHMGPGSRFASICSLEASTPDSVCLGDAGQEGLAVSFSCRLYKEIVHCHLLTWKPEQVGEEGPLAND